MIHLFAMDEQLTKDIESLGFVSAEAFLRWQFTKYLLEESVRLETEIQVYKNKYNCDYETFEKRFSPEHEEVFEEWDDSILWEFLEISLKHTKRLLTDMNTREQAVYSEENIKRGVDPDFLGFNINEEDTDDNSNTI